MASYVDTVYSDQARPLTDYPKRLCAYLAGRFQIPQGAKILDAGCGRGDFSNGFRDNGFDVFGLDREPHAAKKVTGIATTYCDLEKDKFPYADNSFDVVFSKSVIEHLFDPQNFIRECRRVLKPGGRIILLTPDWTSTMKIFFDDYTHRQPYTVTAIKELLDIFDFRQTRAEIFYQLPMVWRYPILKIASRILQMVVPVTLKSPIKFIRWSVELMILATGVK